MQRIAAIAPLRALAAGLVLLSHVAFWTGADGIDGAGRLLARGDSGVAVFFAISAFLLTRAACDPAAPLHSGMTYWRHRAARILPAYWLALVGVLLFAGASGTAGGLGSIGKVVAHVLLLQGFTTDAYQGFTQTWSLTTEVTFYAVVPFITRWLRRCTAHGTSPLPWLGGVAALGVIVQALSASSGVQRLGPLSTSAVGHAAWFAAGIALAWNETRRPDAGWGSARLLGAASTAYMLAASPLGGPLDLSTPSLLQAGVKEVLYASIAWCLVGAAVRVGGKGARVFAAAPWQRAGDLSYGVFLWHVLIIQVLFVGLGLPVFHAPFGYVLVPTVIASTAVAALSWTAVEARAIAAARRQR